MLNCLCQGRIIYKHFIAGTYTYFKDLVLNKDLFGIFGSLFIFQGPYFHFFGLIHAKNVNSGLHVYNNGSGLNCWQILIFTYVYALIFIHRRFGSLFWLLRVLFGSLFHKKMGPYWLLISKLGGLYKF